MQLIHFDAADDAHAALRPSTWDDGTMPCFDRDRDRGVVWLLRIHSPREDDA